MSGYYDGPSVQATGVRPDGQVMFGDDSRLNVRFFRDSILHGVESSQAGRPVKVGIDMCGIRQPGERDEWIGQATEIHKMRFPNHWQAYLEKREHVPDGTPLDIIFPNEPETVENLRTLKVYTVEQLAGLQANAIARIGMGSQLLVNKAQKFMEQATSYQSATRMDKDMKDLRDENERLKKRLEAMERLLGADGEQPPRRGPGRPRLNQIQPDEAAPEAFAQENSP